MPPAPVAPQGLPAGAPELPDIATSPRARLDLDSAYRPCVIIFYGTRRYGVVDRHQGEYAATRFFHIYWLPLIPLGSLWVTDDDVESVRGVPIGLELRSVAAAYGRTWGVVAAIALFVSGGVAGIAGGVAVAAGSAASWLWRSQRSERLRRRSDLMRAATGVGCSPRSLPRQTAGILGSELDDAWQRALPERAPEDVARDGAASPGEAALAYATLALRARAVGGTRGKKLHALAERILDAPPEPAAGDGDPYRLPADVRASIATRSY